MQAKSESMQSAIGDFSIRQPFHFLIGWKNLLPAFSIDFLFNLCAGKCCHVDQLQEVSKLTESHKHNDQTKWAPCIWTPLSLPPLLTHMGVYQQVINVSPSIPPLTHSLLNGMCVLLSLMDSFLLPSPSRVPKGALISHHKDKSMSERERDGFGLAQT